MLKDFNLILSTYRNRENDCISEAWYYLREFGAKTVEASKTGLPGLVVVKTDLNPFYFSKRLRELLLEKPWEVRFILKVVPVEKVVETELDTIKSEAVKLAKEKIAENETYKIEVNVRLSSLRRREVIEAIAPLIPNKVKLDNPDKIVRIEILGDLTAISVHEPDQVVSVVKIKREAQKRE